MVRKIDYESLSRDEIISEIMKKKEFSDLPRADVELVYDMFSDEDFVSDKIKMSRELLMKMYTAFVSDKLLSVKEKDAEWFLNKHKSTKERLGYYEEVYARCLNGIGGEKISLIDFGCGVNGFSYGFFGKVGFDVSYLGLEPVGQLVDLQNSFFEKKHWDAKCVRASLFDLNGVKEIVGGVNGLRVGFFFKVMDSLEMLKRDYSKEVLISLVPLFNRCVVSWATKSLGDRKKIFATKKWLRDFIVENFNVLDEFEFGGENYLVFERK